MRRFAKVAFPIALVVVQVSAGYGLEVLDRNVPKQESWWYLSAAALGLATFILTVVAAIQADRLRQAQASSDLLIAAYVALAKIGAEAKVDVRKLGLHVYLRRRTFFHLHPGIQERRARAILRERQPSQTVWTEGKGVVGVCWKERHKPVWWHRANHKAGTTMGMSKGLFDRGDYVGIVAVPILSQEWGKTRYKGCVTLDCVDDDAWLKIVDCHEKVQPEMEAVAAAARTTLRN